MMGKIKGNQVLGLSINDMLHKKGLGKDGDDIIDLDLHNEDDINDKSNEEKMRSI